MNVDATAYKMAQSGLQQIEEAVLKLLEVNPQGLRNAQIADLLDLRSGFRGHQRDYLTYSVLGGLLAKGKIIRNDETKLYTNVAMKREDIDVATIGKAMYDEIRGGLEETQKGKMIVIDVLSGDYEIGNDDLEVTMRLIERRPDALTWGELIGYPAPYRMGVRIHIGSL